MLAVQSRCSAEKDGRTVGEVWEGVSAWNVSRPIFSSISAPAPRGKPEEARERKEVSYISGAKKGKKKGSLTLEKSAGV